MANDRSLHPCFNAEARHKYGRIHLPVAPKCNIQCNFCNRKFDCVNESRPGVTSKVLSPGQALAYLGKYLEFNPNISTVGIAGPGDPMANPAETLETIGLIHREYPDLLFCLSSNGLQLSPYIKQLAESGVSHVTVTVNAVDPEIGAKIYAWVRDGKTVYRGHDGAALLLEKQLQAIKELKEAGMTVKINTIIIPGINETQIPEIASQMKKLGADVMNCMPLFPAKDSKFEDLEAPSAAAVEQIRSQADVFIPQMKHCARCRADAAGLIGAAFDQKTMSLLADASKLPLIPGQERPYIAATTMEGILINQHLGEATHLHIFNSTPKGIELVEIRPAPQPGGGTERWKELSCLLKDCHTILVSGVGETPLKVLLESGIKVYETEGLIDRVIQTLTEGGELQRKASVTKCGFSCKGDGLGCG